MTQSGGWGGVRDPKEGRGGGGAAVVVCNGVGGKHGGGGRWHIPKLLGVLLECGMHQSPEHVRTMTMVGSHVGTSGLRATKAVAAVQPTKLPTIFCL
jgi:hypothetical protein